MAFWGKFIVNNAPLVPLTIYGVGTFMAFSGEGIYRNSGGCTGIVGNGPLPHGRYWIVDRPKGGVRSQLGAWSKDLGNSLIGKPTHHAEWFALYRCDGQIDDWTWIHGVKRGNFRLHPTGGAGHSFGCITLPSQSDFQAIRRAFLNTKTIPAGRSGLDAYGWIEVVTHGNTCP
ncbi:DUF2778 domain-containing protein [Burkholderia sp. 3C]